MTAQLTTPRRASARRTSQHRRREATRSGFLTVFVALGALVMIVPFLWLIVATTYPTSEIFTVPPHVWFGDYFWQNLTTLFQSRGFGDALRNSLVVATVTTVIAVFICSAAGYAFAKFTFPGRNVIFVVIIASLALPSQVTLVPLFQMMVELGWLNTYPSLILPNLAVPFGIFLMRQSMSSVPDELIQAARVDGAGEFRTFLQIVLPTVRPALAACSIFLFLGQWNDFVYPLVVLRTQDAYTVPVALASLQGVSSTDYGALLTGTLVSITPVLILFLFLQRHFVAGLLAGSVKQ
ncbi:carbohydrate ABC transporter permease [Homoserinibacter sp. GY 40078]|uniref:carbohydrate ABC transporter permease n=1 Tax=Homoserinibacter sp. GY 40078 TaxID=2603275 RepID=UPI0011C744EB|nr:carbohydrate ABC transporter permease [Homoserinibacter sp. GY 40078]TXK18557.1 carbohydrate ABC transporter permease [Homoserinibacter sp. GY 40078]